MARVFLSYHRGDEAKARSLAEAIGKAGHAVWWDRHIKGGAQYSKEIEEALKAADAVVVLWSERSVESAWVRDEAASGRDRGILVPLTLDRTEAPLGFRQYQTIDWSGARPGRARRDALLAAVESVARTEADGSARPVAHRRPRRTQRSGWVVAGLALVAFVAAMAIWRPWATQQADLILAVAAAGSDPASQTLARDLTIRLASLQSTSSGAIRLVEAGEGTQQPDLTFEAAATAPAPANASLILKQSEDSSILWSKNFEQPSGQRADLLQQVAYTAARVTGCVSEGRTAGARLDPATTKTYLNACAQLAEMGSADPRQPVAMLLEVVKRSPRFGPAWSKLILAESELASPEFNAAEPNPRAMAEVRRHIADARKLKVAVAEAAIAEAMLLPPKDFIGRTRRIEQAAALKPDDPAILSFLAGTLSETGRTRKAIEAAARAVQLDPLSPDIHGAYTALLAYGGNFEAARRELAKAEKLWPGTASLRDTQYRFHLRYGDPRIARAIDQQQTNAGGRAPRLYLDARQDPTPANVEKFLSYVRERLSSMQNPSAGIGFAALAYGHFEKTEDVYSTLLTWPKADDVAIISDVLFRPEFGQVRRDPRFLRIARRAGLLDYWRKSGNWPDFCFEPDLLYECKKEAAKLAT